MIAFLKRFGKQAILALAATLIFSFSAGCGVSFHQGPLFDQVDPASLPIDAVSLLGVSHSSYRPAGPAKSVALSLIAAERVLAVRPGSELGNFYAARASLWLLEFGGDLEKDQAKNLADKGFAYAQAALEANQGRPEYVFLCGALLGYQIKQSAIPKLIAMRQVLDYFQRAVELDPSYDDGAPLRALGTLLVLAPPWPTGVGDIDEGIYNLQKAASLFPGHPANHLFLADALAHDGRNTEAISEYQKVLEICSDQRWGDQCAAYLPLATQAVGNPDE